MSSVIHIAEVAALLTIAYAIGWAIGYLVHRLAARPGKTIATQIPAERLAAVTGEAPDALVKAPLIVPVASDPPPPVPQVDVPAAPQPEMPAAPPAAPVPAAAAAEPITIVPPAVPAAPALPPVSIPVVVPPPDLFVRPAPPPLAAEPVASAVPAPEHEPAIIAAEAPVLVEPYSAMATSVAPPGGESAPSLPESKPSAAPALRPGEAWSGEIKGRAPSSFELFAEPPAPEPVAPPPIAAAPAPRVPDDDEDAAMRAIEGGWSRTRARAMPDAPELHDVSAAVAAATAAVQQVLGNTGGDATIPGGKPLGLVRPRSGGKDDLRQITGLGGLDESTLNNLGVFHFDQIAAWSEAEVLWMENHVFARGRIGREDWQAQARKLAAAVSG